ncbi:hypothetical protein DRH27_04735 [Candidatus Falkowbacteria bacterium]|nr:MAG: hypothetical protein DRH27_04735 [Candidatus Falkowbacteria bacterium]
MTALEKKCKDECRRIVIGDGVCEMCDRATGIQHHGLFKSNQRYKLDPGLQYEPDLQFCLCTDCHTSRPEAPHVDNDKFLAFMRKKGGHLAHKAYKVEAVTYAPLVIKDIWEVDFEAILAGLRER